jgi:DNA helicase HerA-like ATPase
MKGLMLGVDGNDLIGIPQRYLTRHGLIAGSTGTGKSRAMQVLAEQLADSGVSVFVSDIKGDASGFCVAGKEHARNKLAPYEPHGIESNYWSITERFIPLRFSLSSVGTVLLSRLLSLNPTQESHLALAFSYAKKNGIPLHDLGQLLDVLDELIQNKARGISNSSVSVIERKVLALRDSGAGSMFGRPSVGLEDLRGMNVLNLSDSRKDMSVSIAPAFLLQMLFESLPEKGDVERPEYVIFFDEAHYLFKNSNKSLQDLMVTILKQIRSKGVSVFFITQDVTDLPDDILSQLSTKIIFSQKVFTQKGNRRLKALASSFPESEVDVLERLKRMPPGVAIVSTLADGGSQTEPREVDIFAPATTMEIVPDEKLIKASDPALSKKYARQSRKTTLKKETKRPEAVAIHPAPAKPKAKEKPIEKKKKGPSIWDGIFKFLLKLLDFILKALGKIFSFLVFKPLKKYYKWTMKKKIRILWTLLFLLLLYIAIVNWQTIQAFLDMLKL